MKLKSNANATISLIKAAIGLATATACWQAANAASGQVEPTLQAIDSSAAQIDESIQVPSKAPPSPADYRYTPYQPSQQPDASQQPGPGFAAGFAPVPPLVQQKQSADEQRVGQLEQSVFGSSYPEHEIPDRLEHLEREVFGDAQYDGSLQVRLSRLENKVGGQNAFSNPGNPALMPQSTPPPRPVAANQTMPVNRSNQILRQSAGRGYQPNRYAANNYSNNNFHPDMTQANGYPLPGYSGASYPGTYPTGNNYQDSNYQNGNFPPSGYQPGGYATAPYQQQPMRYQQPAPYQQQATPYQQPAPYQTANPYRQFPAPEQSQPPAAAYQPPQSTNHTPPITNDKETTADDKNEPTAATSLDAAVKAIPGDAKAGEYSAQIQQLAPSAYARWTSLPIKLHVPLNSPAGWQTALESSIQKWSHCLPLTITPTQEPADIEIAWINHLQPKQLGTTNLEIFNGHMRITVYLLRPSYYPPGINEKSLQQVAAHQLGHALGLFGHSAEANDIMHPLDNTNAALRPRNISRRDMNTLKHIYQAKPLPAGFQSAQPISWP